MKPQDLQAVLAGVNNERVEVGCDRTDLVWQVRG